MDTAYTITCTVSSGLVWSEEGGYLDGGYLWCLWRGSKYSNQLSAVLQSRTGACMGQAGQKYHDPDSKPSETVNSEINHHVMGKDPICID